MMQLEPGMRVRCVRRASTFLTIGKEYEIISITHEYVWIIDDTGRKGNWLADRFKPVVRVHMRTCPRGSNPPHSHSDIVA